MVGTILTVLIGGIIIGLLGKFLAPGGKDNIPFWLTIVAGIIGMLVGNYLYAAIFDNTNTAGIDWWRHVWQIVVAAIAVVVLGAVTGKNRSKV